MVSHTHLVGINPVTSLSALLLLGQEVLFELELIGPWFLHASTPAKNRLVMFPSLGLGGNGKRLAGVSST